MDGSMIKNAIANMSGYTVEVDCVDGEKCALAVATRPLKTHMSRIGFLTNPSYGREMNKNGSYGGTPVLIHDGADSVAWGFAEVGTTFWTADSTDRFYDTAQSVKSANTAVGSYAQFTNNAGPGTDIDLSSYVAFTMWINVDSDWDNGDSVDFQGIVDAGLVGNSVALEDYFDHTKYDVWQFIAIPVGDMGLSATSIDAVRFTQAARDGAKSPTYYLDLITLEETGSPIEYSIKPSKNRWFYIDTLHITMADNIDSEIDTGANTKVPTMYGLSYDKFLGMTPTEGLKLEVYRNDSLVEGSSLQITNLGDMLSVPDVRITNAIADGTNTMISVERKLSVPIILKVEEEDELRVTLSDNFSVLLLFRFSVMGYEEIRS